MAPEKQKRSGFIVSHTIISYRDPKQLNRRTISIYAAVIVTAVLGGLLWQQGLFHLAAALLQAASTTTACPAPATAVPQYVLDYAPLVWLDVSEPYFPSDISCQVRSTYFHPDLNLTSIPNPPTLTLDNLDQLNDYGNYGGEDVYLTSNVDITTNPQFLYGVRPDATGKTNDAVSMVIVVTDKGLGNVDAFYMYFYAYNLGNTVLGNELGDHVGDWEHNMIRFKDGVPTAIWYSQHSNGEAFEWGVVEKRGNRPYAYSAVGSHGVYATAGAHDHTFPNLDLPFKFLVTDHTSAGTLWDPLLNRYNYNYNPGSNCFTAAGDSSPTAFMNYVGRWGDQQYADSDPRQKAFFTFRKYVAGPTGPQDKQLNRTNICPSDDCIVRDSTRPIPGPITSL
ncbi:hypothetical protein B7494_g4539 [Chlorociboria aeruginascens]|nr:hypothetical protein B7494_g4539 [Chlorociboria aeruginascens]